MGVKYIDVKNDILKKIQAGEYKEGHLIPSEIELAKNYGVSRPTIRQAIGLLVEDNLLERKKRRGTIVSLRKVEQAFTQAINSFDSQIHAKGCTSKTHVISFQKEVANKEVKNILNSETVYKLVRLRYIDDLPNVYVTTYISCNIFPNLEKYDFAQTSFYSICELYGHKVTTVERELEITTSDATLSDLLQIEPESPLFYFKSKGFDQNGIPVEYSISKYRSDTSKFVFTLKSE